MSHHPSLAHRIFSVMCLVCDVMCIYIICVRAIDESTTSNMASLALRTSLFQHLNSEIHTDELGVRCACCFAPYSETNNIHTENHCVYQHL